MATITQKRQAQVAAIAAALGARVAVSEERNHWDVSVAGKPIGRIRYDARAKLWLATTGKETTVGPLLGCLAFVIRRC